jgi:hypothetical protein
LWRVIADGQTRQVEVDRTGLLHDVLEVRTDAASYDERWDGYSGPLSFAAFALGFGAFLIALGAVVHFWVPLKAYFWDSTIA